MAYDETLADRIRAHVGGHAGIAEKKMFGGLALMLGGNMCVGVVKEDLMVRVGPDAYEEVLALPGARPMDFTGKPLRGFVFVDAETVAEDMALHDWIGRGLAFAASLPAK